MKKINSRYIKVYNFKDKIDYTEYFYHLGLLKAFICMKIYRKRDFLMSKHNFIKTSKILNIYNTLPMCSNCFSSRKIIIQVDKCKSYIMLKAALL